jgi:hypothetical protein
VAVDVPVPSASASASTAGEGCFLAPFPADTFAKVPVSFASLCKETDPRKGATVIRDEVIRVSVNRRTSQAMTEWGVLSWYEMVVFAAVRGRCCPGAAPLELPEIKPCVSLKDALNDVSKAAAGPLDRGALAAPLKRYDEGLQCILRVGATGHYGRTRPPLGDGVDALKQALDRMR